MLTDQPSEAGKRISILFPAFSRQGEVIDVRWISSAVSYKTDPSPSAAIMDAQLVKTIEVSLWARLAL